MILILGGTAEARELAGALTARNLAVTSSLAGRVSNPRLPDGEVRIGGFGGPDGLRRWLTERNVVAVVDATHPFAQRISDSAALACAAADVPLLRLQRPPFAARPGDRWHRVADLAGAAALLPTLGQRVFLTTGRQGIEAFAALDNSWFLIRCVEPPTGALPRRHELVLSRGPYTLEGERRLFERHRIEVLVSKDSGGQHTEPKLQVARELGLPVILVARPPRPKLPTVTTVAEALSWVLELVGQRAASTSRSTLWQR